MARRIVIWIVALVATASCRFDESGLAAVDGDDGPVDASIDSRVAEADAAVIDAAVTTDAPVDAATADAPVDAPPDAPVDAAPDAPVDAVPDATVDADPCPGSSLSITPSNFDECDISSPDGPLSLVSGSWTFDTDSGQLTGPSPMQVASAAVTQSGGPDIRVISVDSLTIADGASLEVTGSLPLAIVSFSDAGVAGTLSVGADLDIPGPGGSLDSVCADGTGTDGVPMTMGMTGAGAGGGGGGHGAAGGNGAKVDGTDGPDAPIQGGTANGTASITPLRGGCGGGDGAGPANNAPTTAGGGGGGAIQIVADGTVRVRASGVITAHGGGGRGATPDETGGGGGGSGGAILLEAGTSVSIAGAVTANGGGGGEGTRGPAADGQDGSNGLVDSAAAPGGSGGSAGGDGGAGGALLAAAADGLVGSTTGAAAAGGGGGGGAVGRIHFNTLSVIINPNAVVSPVAQ